MLHVMFRSDWKSYGCKICDWCHCWFYGANCFQEHNHQITASFLGQNGNPTDGLPCNMDIIWTTYYEKDFTWIVLELIGVLEQRIRVVTISKVNALRFTLVIRRKQDPSYSERDLELYQVWRQTRGKQVWWWMILLARQKSHSQINAKQLLGKIRGMTKQAQCEEGWCHILEMP